MKRYLLFSGDDYYPCGGWDDFEGDFDTLEESLKLTKKHSDDWCHVVDTVTMKIIKIGMSQAHTPDLIFFDTEEQREDYVYKKAKERGRY